MDSRAAVINTSDFRSAVTYHRDEELWTLKITVRDLLLRWAALSCQLWRRFLCWWDLPLWWAAVNFERRFLCWWDLPLWWAAVNFERRFLCWWDLTLWGVAVNFERRFLCWWDLTLWWAAVNFERRFLCWWDLTLWGVAVNFERRFLCWWDLTLWWAVVSFEEDSSSCGLCCCIHQDHHYRVTVNSPAAIYISSCYWAATDSIQILHLLVSC